MFFLASVSTWSSSCKNVELQYKVSFGEGTCDCTWVGVTSWGVFVREPWVSPAAALSASGSDVVWTVDYCGVK